MAEQRPEGRGVGLCGVERRVFGGEEGAGSGEGKEEMITWMLTIALVLICALLHKLQSALAETREYLAGTRQSLMDLRQRVSALEDRK
jgi:hypothetical protein